MSDDTVCYDQPFPVGWKITASHPAASDAIPVLVDPNGVAYHRDDEIEIGRYPGINRGPIKARSLANEVFAAKLATEAEYIRFVSNGRYDTLARWMVRI